MDCVENTPPLGSFNTCISLDELTKLPAPPQEISQTHFQFEGFHYVHQSKPKFNEKSEAWTRYYRCKHYRPPNSCKATLIVKCSYTENVSMKASIVQHTCLTVKAVQVGGIEDVTQLMSEEISAKAVEQSTTTAPKLAQQIRTQYEEIHKGKPVLMLDLPKLERAVYRARSKAFSDWESEIKCFPLAFCDPLDSNPKLFFRFMVDVVLNGEICKIVGWAHPSLTFLLRAGSAPTYIDGTFKVVPHGFYQLLILMVFSKLHGVYVPVWFILLPGKKENLYIHALQMATSCSEWKLEASTITCDFEVGLMNACKMQFCGPAQQPPAVMVGCLFHFKQAIRRKLLKDYLIPSSVVSDLC